MERSRFSWIPNAISLARLACLPVLLALAWSGQDRWFAWLLLPALASDVLDGWLARRLDAVSRLGSLLDSVADILLVLVMVYAIWPLHPGVAQEHGWIFLGVVAIWCVAHLASLLPMVDTHQTRAPEFRAVMGDADFEDTLKNRRAQVRATADRVLVREMYLVEAA